MIMMDWMSYLTTGDPDKERETNQLEYGRGQLIIRPANLSETFTLEFISAERCEHHPEGPWVRPNMGTDDWPETTWKVTLLP